MGVTQDDPYQKLAGFELGHGGPSQLRLWMIVDHPGWARTFLGRLLAHNTPAWHTTGMPPRKRGAFSCLDGDVNGWPFKVYNDGKVQVGTPPRGNPLSGGRSG